MVWQRLPAWEMPGEPLPVKCRGTDLARGELGGTGRMPPLELSKCPGSGSPERWKPAPMNETIDRGRGRLKAWPT